MTVLQTSQLAAEVLQSPSPNLRTSQLVVEVLQLPSGNARVSQLVVEVLRVNAAAVINDRDLLLQATVPRFTAATTNALLLSAATPFFHVNSSGTPSPSAITVTATLMGGLSGTVAFTAAGGSTITTSGNTATLTYAALGAASSEVINASIAMDGTTYTASILLTKVVDGSSGAAGGTQRVCYSVTTLSTLASTPATITTSGNTSFPANGSWGTGTIWTGAPTTSLAAGESLYRSDGQYDPVAGNTVWTPPYLSSLKVGQLSAIAVDAGSITAGDFYGVTIHGGPGYPTNAYSFPTGSVNGGFHLSAAGLLLGNFNAGKYFQVTSGGDIYAPGFVVVAGAATFSGALSAASGTFAGTLTAAAVNAVNTINIAGNAVTVPYAATTTGTTYGAGLTNWLLVATGSITLAQAGMVYAASTGLIAYGTGWCPAQSRLDINGATVSGGGGEEAWVNAAHSGGLSCSAGTITVNLYFSATDSRARIIDPTLFIQGAYR
jgi:hypothetical protein